MALTDQPYLPLYVNQWISNKKLKFCSPAAHGIMINVMALMHKEDEYGVILLEQMFKRTDSQVSNFAIQLSKLTAFDSSEIVIPLTELIDKKVLRIHDEKLICNRMVRDANISHIRSEIGSGGGKKTQSIIKLAKAKNKANAVNVIVNDSVNENEEKEGVGENENNLSVVPKQPLGTKDPIVPFMLKIFKKVYPDYLDDDADYRALRLIALKIKETLKLPSGTSSFENDDKKIILKFWQELVEYSATSRFFSSLQLSTIQTQLSGLIKSYRNEVKQSETKQLTAQEEYDLKLQKAL